MQGNGAKIAGAVVISAALVIGLYFAVLSGDDSDTTESQATSQNESTTTTPANNAAGTSELAPVGQQEVSQDPSHVDGTYSADATYIVPSGDTESISVTLTLADDSITNLQVEMVATHPTSERYQGQFDDAVAGDVEGEDIDEVDATRIGGASLTSNAFNDILEAIREQSAQS